ncbi:hypothetical protein ASG73_16270 [Janibacter sp. Soil728]|uniref:glycosyltransferase n=1 Tax=Janibacter sp. Soil728 TaxID=1736393 RepID=UPI0006F8661A|nr:glycosyltransferase [Janibacter sp. Soil728]KRE35489.1 hypothetical protein ASG73_16270 [Janibacter sp. Soil728]
MRSHASRDVLVLSLLPHPFATRTRKAAEAYAGAGHRVRFLAPQRAGRTVDEVEAGVVRHGGVVSHHVVVPRTDLGSSGGAQLRNALLSFLPALLRMIVVTLRSPADVVHVTGVPLVPVAMLHRARFGSRLIMDVNERPASVTAKGSLFGTISRFEPIVIRAAAPQASLVTVVAPGHAEILRSTMGVRHALVVRNAPLAEWRTEWVDQPEAPPLRVVTVGSLFPGRALELLIRAAAIARREGTDLRVAIFGSGRPDYLQSLRDLIVSEGVEDIVSLEGRIDSSQVSQTYTVGHVGLALYEGADPGNDSLSNKIIETVASGRPVLAGDLPENRAFITEFGVGWLTEVSAEAIAAALRNIASRSSRDDLQTLGQHCHAVAGESLTWESEFGKVLAAVDGFSVRRSRWGR